MRERVPLVIVRFILSALGALWVLAGILSLTVAMTTPRDPDAPTNLPDLDAAQLVMLVWYSLALVAFGPFGLSRAIDNRDERRKKLAADRGRQQGT